MTRSPDPHESAGPVFIVGASHAGKTPLRMLLDHHPDIALTRHVGWWMRHWGRLGDLRRPDQLLDAVRTVCADPDVAPLGPDVALVLAEVRRAGPPSYPALFGAIHQLHARSLSRPRWGVQLKGLEDRGDAVLDAFPTGRMLHLVRTPGGRPRPAWRRWFDPAERRAGRRPHQYRIIRYDDFAADPVATLVEVCELCELEATPAMLDAASGLRFDRWDGPLPRGRLAAAVQRVLGPTPAGTATGSPSSPMEG